VTDVSDALCASCGAAQPHRFCERCGEKRITTHDYSIVHFGETLVETLTHFDIRSLRALRLLVVRPGALTRAYLDGQRRAYVGPIQLFVILNIVFAFFGANTFRTPLAVQQQSWMPELKQRMVATAKARKALGDEEFEREFDRTAGLQAKTWVFSMVPAYAICLAVLYGFRRAQTRVRRWNHPGGRALARAGRVVSADPARLPTPAFLCHSENDALERRS